VFVIEGIGSMGGTMFTVGISFYTANRFGWGLRENFRLAATQGAVYVAGALLAGRVAARMPHQRATLLLHGMMALLCAAGTAAGGAGAVLAVVAVLLAYTFTSAVAWPILESLTVLGTSGPGLARRLAIFNVVWPVVGAATIAVSGRVIEVFPAGVFLFPAVAHAVAVVCATWAAPVVSKADSGSDIEPQLTEGHLVPEPELLRVRKLALWVSRLGLPATYAVIYGLMPLMPALPAMQRLDTANQTLVTSAWLAARWLAFIGLAVSAWWHTKPLAMVAAAVLMLVAFLGITVAPSQIWGGSVSPGIDLAAILLWQLALGAALGMIYSGSLYFGMVLSEGSTEHSGYHEALIGLGWILGPAAGAVTEFFRPNDLQAGIVAVGFVIAASVGCVVVASAVAGKKQGAITDDPENTDLVARHF
jgi:hypothetical protein